MKWLELLLTSTTLRLGGLSVDLQKAGTLVVASLNSWWPDAQLFRSTDSGSTWKKLWHWENYPGKVLNYTQSTPKASTPGIPIYPRIFPTGR